MRLAEKMWAILKRNFTNQFFKTLEYVRDFIANSIKTLSLEQIIKICNYQYAFCPEIWTI